MKFYEFNKAVIEHVTKMQQYRLLEVKLDKGILWENYLNSFAPEYNPMYRTRRIHDCSCCRHFVKQFGNVVAIKDGKIITMWDFQVNDPEFDPVLKEMAAHVRDEIEVNGFFGIFKHYESNVGTERSLEKNENGIIEYNHFFIPKLKTDFVAYKDEIPTIKGNFNTDVKTFKRSLEEINMDAIDTVLDLINDGVLYRGEEQKGLVVRLKAHKAAYEMTENQKLYIWEMVPNGSPLARIKNTSIGTLLSNLSEGEDIEVAVKKYEAVMAPANYKRPKAIFTQKMLEEAQAKVVELGFGDSLARRVATLDDLNINNAFYVDRGVKTFIPDMNNPMGDIFGQLSKEVTVKPNKINAQVEMSIEKFLEEIQNASTVKLLMENRFKNNMMTMTTAKNTNALSMFKWDNSYAWSYEGGLTDTNMKENVKAAGGKVDGVMRFSIQWNDLGRDGNDLDAHCWTPDGTRIYFRQHRDYRTGGELDVDIQHPSSGKPAVENITFPSLNKLTRGTYTFRVHNFSHRGGRDGFRAEIEVGGEVYSFDYRENVKDSTYVDVAEVYFDGQNFTVTEKLPSTSSSIDIWGLKTNQFITVSGVSLSPNHWGDNAVGNKHYLFFLKDCVNPENVNGFFNEYLHNDLTPHRRVFEAMSNKMYAEHMSEELSGVGISSTNNTHLIFKVDGKIIKVEV